MARILIIEDEANNLDVARRIVRVWQSPDEWRHLRRPRPGRMNVQEH
jgi:hypothetical protein